MSIALFIPLWIITVLKIIGVILAVILILLGIGFIWFFKWV